MTQIPTRERDSLGYVLVRIWRSPAITDFRRGGIRASKYLSPCDSSVSRIRTKAASAEESVCPVVNTSRATVNSRLKGNAQRNTCETQCPYSNSGAPRPASALPPYVFCTLLLRRDRNRVLDLPYEELSDVTHTRGETAWRLTRYSGGLND